MAFVFYRCQFFLLSILLISTCYGTDDNPGKREESNYAPPAVLSSGFVISDQNGVVQSNGNEDAESSKPNLNLIRLSRTLGFVGDMLSGFGKLFSPPSTESSSSAAQAENTDATIQKAAAIITGHGVPAPLLARIPNLIGNPSSDYPNLKSSEYSTMLQSAVRIGMQQRPQHFTTLAEGKDVSSDTPFDIGAGFLREFTQGGALYRWLPHFRQTAEANTTDASQQAAVLEFMDGAAKFLKWVGSDDVHDPKKDPLNKYVNSADIEQLIRLEKWLEENRGHEDYDAAQRQFMDLDQRIKTARSQAMEEGGQYVFSLLKRMDPRLGGMENPSDIMDYKKEEWAETERQEFEKYVLTEFGKSNIFEPNLLRSFWEKIERHQYGKVFYRIVCESFAAHQDSPLHQKVQQIWLASHLDTIHCQPQDARTRMPAASIDGLFGPNFGYRMERSAAYQGWIENPLVRASGDVIMDAFHWVVDFGCAFDEGVFLKRLETYLWGSKKEKRDQFLSQNEYDSFLIPFQLYLLENTFGTPFVQGRKKTIPGELKKADSKENLITIARQALADFKTVAHNMFALRPDGQPLTEADLRRGLVFGIGFNGKLFDSPNHSAMEEDEIWLTFSDSRRDNGGSVLLSFLKHVAKQRSRRLTVGTDPARNFDRYKPLIRRHLNQQIQDAYYVPNSHWDAHEFDYIQQERARLEGFMSQLEQDLPFASLTTEFKKWIQDASNWYSLPPKVKVQTAPDMPEEEHVVQYAARNLLFDALNRRSFSTEHRGLIPHLFSHWKQEILKQFSGREAETSAIELAQEFEDLPVGFQQPVASLIDRLAAHVHPELRTIWEPSINAFFGEFLEKEAERLGRELVTAGQNIKNTKKQLEGFKKAITDVSSKIAQARQFLVALEQQKQQDENEKQQLPHMRNPVELSKQAYERFRSHFFKKRDVSQCAEPLFSRVLGHDRFFSVLISKKSGLTDIRVNTTLLPLQLGNKIPQDVIAPCDKRCQHHALGHLYAGDMLGYQSADHLDHMRRTHDLGEVPDRLMTLSNS